MQINQFDHDLKKRVSVLEQGLSQLGQGIILLSKSGQVLFSTDVANEMLSSGDGLTVKEGMLMGVLKPDNVRLQHMRGLVLEDSASDENYHSFYIHRNNQQKPYLLLISKMNLDASLTHADDGVLIIIKDTHANAQHWQERMKSLFRLTKREADFVVFLTEGRNIKEISTVMSIAEDTARQYLKNCFKKMEVNKQHELVCLALDSLRKR
ncbi:MAG: helix-turn-helix transcriptional regulator [Methylophilaceae bacterium]|nr:MAG: helix-turn-helix transcriptional regulator [Methylophilaceae bacterium]